MYKENGRCCFSPSDLTRFMASPFASWMDRFALEHPEQAMARDPREPFMDLLAQKGFAHENALEAEFRAGGLSVLKISGGSRREVSHNSCLAMAQGFDVIVQARLELPPFAGYSDFLIKVAGASKLGDFHYEVWDTKLAHRVKPSFVVQLCCYAEMLQAMQGLRPAEIAIVLGDGERQRLQTQDYYAYYEQLKASFMAYQERFSPSQMPDPADSKYWENWSHCAEQLLLEQDHLFQVATIRRGQIKKLQQAGIMTMTALANWNGIAIKGMPPPLLARLQLQAKLQIETQQQSAGQTVPCFKILPPQAGEQVGLALLPPHSPSDVFFDIEGYALEDGGLEYLWGCAYFNADKACDFKDFWAHNREQEKAAFAAFIRWVYARWQHDPEMHIYHYASYEITVCRRLMGRYGICEHEVDQLLRNEVFVDLYKVVKGGLLLGERRYSIKNVEHLYRSGRDTAVRDGGESVMVYEQWRELHAQGEQGDSWQESSLLKDLRDYNMDDCYSTQELVDWLRHQQQLHGIAFVGKKNIVEPEEKELVTARTELRDRLLQRALRERESDPLQAAVTENMAWMLEFHRREAKPVFWLLFERFRLGHQELLDDLDCLACCKRSSREPFKPQPRARNYAYEYCFEPTQECRAMVREYYLLGENENGNHVKLRCVREESDLERGLIVLQAKQEPPAFITLVPDEYVNPNPIPLAIDASAAEYEQGTGQQQAAIIDFLRRAKPRFLPAYTRPGDNDAIAPSADPALRLAQIVQAVCHLDNSYLTIQGPPGAGKSYTGKHVIAALLKSGARIGIASNSHKAINNLLLSTVQYCRQEGISASFCGSSKGDPELTASGIEIVQNKDLAEHVRAGCVLGATAWGFSRADMAGQLDYLFVDEAGQVAVANLVAMSRAANNLILMGDQMQLGQPSQGSHPAESGLSVLDYLLHEKATIEDDMGVFLSTTYRMHSKVNRFISEHIYEGRLASHPDNDHRMIELPSAYQGPLNHSAGIVFIPCRHEGNTQSSDEEVATVKELAMELLGRTFHTGDPASPTRPITWDDMLFVAPYNHQVRKLRQALGEQAKVGSVDKFQGQEAAIVLLSLCASDVQESPRGLGFLFDPHRLNVAISRAQTLALVVANPDIGRTPVTQIQQLRLLNLFNALQAYQNSPAESVSDFSRISAQ